MQPILAEIEQVDFETSTAVFKIPAEARVISGKYWLVPYDDILVNLTNIGKHPAIDGVAV